jgi:hypothetical protein
MISMQLGCYNAPVGSPLPFGGPAERVIARVFADAAVDTSIYLRDALQAPALFASVVSTDGLTAFYVAGATFQGTSAFTPTPVIGLGATAGVRYTTGVPAGGVTGQPAESVQLYNAAPVTSLLLLGGTQLFVAKPWVEASSSNTGDGGSTSGAKGQADVADAEYCFGQLGAWDADALPTDAATAVPDFASFAMLAPIQVWACVVTSLTPHLVHVARWLTPPTCVCAGVSRGVADGLDAVGR